MFQRILVPLDGSPRAEHALPYALELARLSGGAMILARVIPSATVPPPRFSATDAGTWLIRQSQMREEAEQYLEHMARNLEAVAPAVHTLISSGQAGEGLWHIIEQQEIDVVVMAVRHRSLARRVLGSTVDYLAQRAPVPILMVNPAEASADDEGGT
jgi:nucleotide-binding universal stress UspA family protein